MHAHVRSGAKMQPISTRPVSGRVRMSTVDGRARVPVPRFLAPRRRAAWMPAELLAGNAAVPYDEAASGGKRRPGGFAGRGPAARHPDGFPRFARPPLVRCPAVRSVAEVEFGPGPEREVAAGGDRQGPAGGGEPGRAEF
ncbi:hypothetical protein SSP531S_53030 [Streptomyces spongiicola]|uniref:Uncharacterized protein n=1 Tax=Streptomyces spongiicola TaxID=1690221 RepID=A0A388T8J3_9ACTN|nr:hypothetical protein SSP531S_53030 [Streptomyces spongiicola]